jgi:oligopeptide transport system permease protein
MMTFIVRRLLILGPVLFIVLTVTFIMVSVAPGSPLAVRVGQSVQVQTNLRAKYGLDQPRWRQYARYMARIAGVRYDESGRPRSWRPRPDFGDSLRYRDRTVNEIIAEALPISAVLGLAAYLTSLVVGIPLGIAAAARPRSWVDRGLTAFAAFGSGVPSFVLGPLLVLIFSLSLYWLPPARIEWLVESKWLRIPSPSSIVLPAITLATGYATTIARIVRGAMLDALAQPFVRAARARGVGKGRLLLRHLLPIALLPVVSFSGPALAFLMTGTIVVERVFAIPGLGRYFIDATLNRDYFLILGLTAFGAVALMAANLVVDVAYAWLDPRIGYE